MFDVDINVNNIGDYFFILIQMSPNNLFDAGSVTHKKPNFVMVKN